MNHCVLKDQSDNEKACSWPVNIFYLMVVAYYYSQTSQFNSH